MNHAFLVIAHDSPELLQRIVDIIQAPNHYVFVHLDKKSNDPFVNIQWGGYIPEDKRIKVSWGGFSMIKVELLLLREALKNPIHFDYFHLISGHDYPCVDNESFDRFFEQCPDGRSYMHFDTDKQHVEWTEKISWRINNWHFPDDNSNTVFLRMYRKFLIKYIKRSYKGELYAGWQWFSWHRFLVEWVLDYLRLHPMFLRRFHHTMCCDEVVFHTLLFPYLEKLHIERNNSLRYIDWYPQRPSETLPLVLDERDVDLIKKSGCLFCRKVSLEKSYNLLNMLDASDRLM